MKKTLVFLVLFLLAFSSCNNSAKKDTFNTSKDKKESIEMEKECAKLCYKAALMSKAIMESLSLYGDSYTLEMQLNDGYGELKGRDDLYDGFIDRRFEKQWKDIVVKNPEFSIMWNYYNNAEKISNKLEEKSNELCTLIAYTNTLCSILEKATMLPQTHFYALYDKFWNGFNEENIAFSDIADESLEELKQECMEGLKQETQL